MVHTGFNLYGANISHNAIIENQSIISVAWKWSNSKKIYSTSLLDNMSRFKKNVFDDYHPVKEFHKVLNSDDNFVLCAHNGDRFDIKKLNTGFIKHGLPPVQIRQSIDTLKEARRVFRFDSNRLDYLARFLEVGEKMDTGGYGLWIDVYQAKYPQVGKVADKDLAINAVKHMVKYNKIDVEILEGIFDKMRPYIKTPNALLYSDRNGLYCPSCMGQDLMKRGKRYTQARVYQGYGCKSCGKRFQDGGSIRGAMTKQ
jgi:hypothetical protein